MTRKVSEGSSVDETPDKLKFFEQPWLVASCVLLAAAAILLYLWHPNATFVVASLGVLAWFLNVRANLQRRQAEREIDGDEQDEQDEELI